MSSISQKPQVHFSRKQAIVKKGYRLSKLISRSLVQIENSLKIFLFEPEDGFFILGGFLVAILPSINYPMQKLIAQNINQLPKTFTLWPKCVIQHSNNSRAHIVSVAGVDAWCETQLIDSSK